jgi:small GTP-binding protein
MESACRMTCLLVGDIGVGKTSLLYTQITGKFPDYIPGTGTEPVTAVVIDGVLYEIQLLDTRSDPDYDKFRIMMYQPAVANIFVLCFSDRKSFENIATKWIPEIREKSTVPIIIAGLKTDLRSETDHVTFDEGTSFAQKIGAVKYLECSAKMGEGVKEIFENVAIYGSKSIANEVSNNEPEMTTNSKKKSKRECSVQ